MAKKEQATNEEQLVDDASTEQKRGRKPGPARQTLIDASEGKETVLRFDSPEGAKSAAYGWWGARRRADLTDKVAIKLNTSAMSVTIGPRRDKEDDVLANPEERQGASETAVDPGTEDAATEDGLVEAPIERHPLDESVEDDVVTSEVDEARPSDDTDTSE